jgi:hypothetical protein
MAPKMKNNEGAKYPVISIIAIDAWHIFQIISSNFMPFIVRDGTTITYTIVFFYNNQAFSYFILNGFENRSSDRLQIQQLQLQPAVQQIITLKASFILSLTNKELLNNN